MEIQGSLGIASAKDENNPEFAKITTINGDLEVEEGLSVTLPALTEISGRVYADQYATVTLPALTKVSGYVDAEVYATLTLPALIEAGDVRVGYGATVTLPALTEVSGQVSLGGFASLTLPSLTKCEGVWAHECNLTLPALTKCTDVDADLGATLTLPALTEVSGSVSAERHATLTLPALTKAWHVMVREGATLAVPTLTEVDWVKIDTVLPRETEDLLLAACDSDSLWNVGDRCSDYLLAELATQQDVTYEIDRVEVSKELFDRVRSGQITPSEVFALTNMEQRRVAYSRLDKSKMAQLPSRVLDEAPDDGYGYPMRLIEIEVEGFEEPFRYLICRSPSTGREYWLETRQTTCQAAKAVSFGMPEDFTFDVEW